MRNEYEIRGDATAIFLRRNTGESIETIISTSDLELVKSMDGSWHTVWDSDTKSFYVKSHQRQSDGTRRTMMLHRWILKVQDPKLHVDHIDHDTLNNTRVNLREATPLQNAQNHIKSPTGLHLGVSWVKPNKKWRVRVKVNKRTIHIGYFDDYEDATLASQKARAKHLPFSQEALQLHGEASF